MSERDELAALNTDRELFREDTGTMPSAYYENSVHVTAQGHLGMNVGGHVYVLPIAEWHRLAQAGHTDFAARDARIREDALAPIRALVEAFEGHYRAGGGPFVQGILHAVNDFRGLLDAPAQADGGEG